MAINRKTTRGRKKQVIYSEPRKIFVKKYLSPKGLKLLATNQFSKEEIWERYGKNKYVINTEAVPVRIIYHN